MEKSTVKRFKTPFLGGLMAVAILLSIPVHSFAARISTPSEALSQQSPVKGTVVDESGAPLIGAGVMVKGTQTGVVTDFDGNFSLNCNPSDILVISMIGFKDVEIRADANLSKIVLVEDHEMLDDVIVIGYGTTTRKSATGSVEAVRSQMLENRPVPNVSQALQGAAANVVIQRRSFDPNSESTNFNIRGISSLNNNSPLFVIDGLVADNGTFNNLNPNDIESISILKDAGTAAIYGSRSANGVVLVTTKGGRKGEQTRVRFGAMAGMNVPNFLIHATEGYANATLTNLAMTNTGQAPKFSQEQIRDLAAHQDEEVWWYYQIFEPALQQDYNASISGGSEKSSYMLSFGFHDQNSNYKADKDYGAERYNMRANISTEIGRLHLTGIMAFTRNNSLGIRSVNLANAMRIPSYYYYNALSSDGTKYLVNDVVNDFTPLGQINSGSFNKNRNNALTTSVNAELKLVDGLKLRGVLGVDIMNSARFTRNFAQTYWPSEDAAEPRLTNASDYISENWNSDAYRTNSQIILDYNKSFNRHTVNVLIGATNESYTSNENSISKKYVDPTLGVETATTKEAGNITGGTSIDNSSRTSISSIIGRAGYNFDDRYYAEFSFRYDGSSKFDEKVRWGFFPSISAGWRISQEPFMDNWRTNVGDLKIRGSYGILGSQSIGDYERYTRYSVSGASYAFNNVPATTASFTIGNPELTWEKTKTFNIGLDASFLRGNLNVTFDWFNKNTVDILLNETTPNVFGTSLPRTNIGKVRNQGWEFTMNYHFTAGATNHFFNLNVGDSKNKVLEYPGHEQIWHSEELWKVIREGEAIGSYYGYKMDGLFQSYEEIENSPVPAGLTVHPGDIKRKDIDGDGDIDSDDRVILGNAFPRYTFGFNYNFEWKGFDLSAFFQGVGKREAMMRGELVEPFHENYSYVIYKHQLDFWSPVNTDAKYPRLAAQGSSSDTNNFSKDYGTDLFIFDTRYIRLKNLAIGYTLPKTLSRKAGMEKCRIYVNAQDLFTWSPTSFFDPEASEFGTNFTVNGSANYGRNYPSIRYFGLGLDIEF